MEQLKPWSDRESHGSSTTGNNLNGRKALYIEDRGHFMLSKFIRGWGWEWKMSAAEVFSCGRTSSTLDDHHIKRTHYHTKCHWSLYHSSSRSLMGPSAQRSLTNQSYLTCGTTIEPRAAPMFQIWSQIIELEQLTCRYVCSLCERNFGLYVKVLDELCPWLFALDHTNYVCWLPIHNKDFVHLHVNHPGVYEEFREGRFVVLRHFSATRRPKLANAVQNQIFSEGPPPQCRRYLQSGLGGQYSRQWSEISICSYIWSTRPKIESFWWLKQPLYTPCMRRIEWSAFARMFKNHQLQLFFSRQNAEIWSLWTKVELLLKIYLASIYITYEMDWVTILWENGRKPPTVVKYHLTNVGKMYKILFHLTWWILSVNFM